MEGNSKLNMYTLKSSLPMFTRMSSKDEPGNYEIDVQAESVSDGYHTMEELYEHRNRLFLALTKIYDNYITPLNCKVVCWKSKFHYDNTFYEGHFILGMTVERLQSFDASQPSLPPYQISYHLPIKYWHLANVMERATAPEWDGHTSKDVLERLLRL